MNDFSRRQVLALTFVASLSPLTRLLPKFGASAAGHYSFLAPLAALPVLIAYIIIICRFLSPRRKGEGLGEVILRTNGPLFGRLVLGIIAAFLLFASAHLLRSGADCFVGTVYPAGSVWPFVLTMLALGLIAALGPRKALMRSARIFAPFLVAVLVFVIGFGLAEADLTELFPLNDVELKPLATAAVPTLEVFAGLFLYTAFFEGGIERRQGRAKQYILWLLPVIILVCALCAAALGSFGAALTARLNFPFFAMVRNITLFRSLERIEAVVVSLWVVPDFIIFSALLCVAAHCLRLIFGGGKWSVWLSCAVILALCTALDNKPELLPYISETLIPALNLAVCFVLVPASLLIALRRTKQ